jgi:hypothetical protein
LHAKLCSGLKLSDFSGFALNNVSRELSWCRTDSEIFSGLELRNQALGSVGEEGLPIDSCLTPVI